MGYSVFITRRKNWFEESGPLISREEWEQFVATRPNLKPCRELGESYVLLGSEGQDEPDWINWENGNLESKNPSKRSLVELFIIAHHLKATLVGEEGERYDEDGNEVPRTEERTSSWRNWFQNLVASCWELLPRNVGPAPFNIGDRVKTPWGRIGKVVKVDMRAVAGLGIIYVDFGDGNIIGISGDDALEKMED